jgi:hypothetical protein
LLHRTLVANGTKRHFAAAQQTVAFGLRADIGEGGVGGLLATCKESAVLLQVATSDDPSIVEPNKMPI